MTVISSTLSKLTDRSKQVAHTFSWRLSTKFLSKRSAACWIYRARESSPRRLFPKEGPGPPLQLGSRVCQGTPESRALNPARCRARARRRCRHAHLLNHADELGESPVELVEDAVEEAGGQVPVAAQQVCHVPLQQGGGARLCKHTQLQQPAPRAATGLGQEQAGACS